MFYFVFKEKVTIAQLIGVSLMITCVICLSVESGLKGNGSEEGDADMEYCFYAIGVALIAPLLMSSKHFMIRRFKPNYKPMDQAMDGFIMEYFCFSMLAIYLFVDGEIPMNARTLLLGMASGCLSSLGRLCIAIAVAVGIAGPAQALMATHSLHQTMWSVFLDGQGLSFL
jgi:drug/metabolite transporter (DMT)-like permease